MTLLFLHPWWTTLWLLIVVGAVRAYVVEKRKRMPAPPVVHEWPTADEMRAKAKALTDEMALVCHNGKCPGNGKRGHYCHDLDCKDHGKMGVLKISKRKAG